MLTFISENENPNNEEIATNLEVQRNREENHDIQMGIPFDATSLGVAVEITKEKGQKMVDDALESLLLQNLSVNQFTKNFFQNEGLKTVDIN